MLKKALKIFAITLIIGFIVFVSVLIYVYNNLEELTVNQIENAIERLSDKYEIKYSDLLFNLDEKSLTVKNLCIKPKLQNPNKKFTLKKLQSKNVVVKNIRYFILILNKTIRADSLIILKPDIELLRDLSIAELKQKSAQKESFLKGIRFDNVVADSGAFRLQNNENKVVAFKNSYFKLKIEDFSYKLANKEKSWGNIDFYAKNLIWPLRDSLHTITLKDIIAASKTNKLYVGQMEYIPKHNKYHFAKKIGYQKSRIYFSLSGIWCYDAKIQTLLNTKTFQVPKVDIEKFNFYGYNDKRVPKKNIEPIMPRQWLKKLKIPLMIDTLNLKSGYISHEIHPDNGKRPVKVYLSQISLNISNITNIKKHISENNSMIANIEANFLGKCKLISKVDFNLNSESGKHIITGMVDRLRLSKLNRLVENLGMIKIKSGLMNSMEFSINGSYSQAHGYLKMNYRDLKVTLLRKKESRRKFSRNRFLSFLANRAIKTNNPSGNKALRIGRISKSRGKYTSLFGFWNECILDGVMHSITSEKINKKINKRKRKSKH